MKRIFSMVLAVMLVITLGALPAAATHGEHFIRFGNQTGEGKLSLPEAHVGVEYSYSLLENEIEKCDGIAYYGTYSPLILLTKAPSYDHGDTHCKTGKDESNEIYDA